ncbi:MAG: fasciclin domain-containing protein [Phormidesmis sp.]
MMDDTVEADAEMTDDTVEADAEMTDDMVEADAEMMDDTVEADAEMTDDTVEADAEMMDDTVEADAEMTDEAVVEGETDETTDPEATASEEINTADFTIAELTDNSDSFTILAAALKAADLTEVLSEEGPYTIFAPTDEAFQALPEGAVQQLLLPENKDVLVQVLTYHVIPGAMLSTDLETGNIATVEGSDIAVDVEDAVTVNNANILVADVQASNGIIHIIDRVIVPPTPEADAEVESEVPEAAIQ